MPTILTMPFMSGDTKNGDNISLKTVCNDIAHTIGLAFVITLEQFRESLVGLFYRSASQVNIS